MDPVEEHYAIEGYGHRSLSEGNAAYLKVYHLLSPLPSQLRDDPSYIREQVEMEIIHNFEWVLDAEGSSPTFMSLPSNPRFVSQTTRTLVFETLQKPCILDKNHKVAGILTKKKLWRPP